MEQKIKKISKKLLKKLQEHMPLYKGYCDICKDEQISTLHFKGTYNIRHLYVCNKCYSSIKEDVTVKGNESTNPMHMHNVKDLTKTVCGINAAVYRSKIAFTNHIPIVTCPKCKILMGEK